jgi:uncharacterized membrane protein
MEMKSDNKSGWVALIGGIAVVASLLLVAWEIQARAARIEEDGCK